MQSDAGKVLVFAYGPTTLRVMQALTGDKNLVGHEAILDGYGLYLQRLGQVPNTVFPTAPAPVSPRQILEESWPKDFEFHTIKPDENGQVKGTVYELTRQEAELFRDFELIAFGWYKEGRGKVVTSDGKELEVEVPVLGYGQEISREVDGLNYDPFFNSTPEKFVQVAEKSRREFFERMGQVPAEVKG